MSAAKESVRVKNAFELHAHTTCSDGTLSPVALVDLAASRRLRALAITDHDTLAAIPEAAAHAAPRGVEVIASVEATCGQGELELHMLGYFLDLDDPSLGAALAAMREDRYARMVIMLERLAQLGAKLEPSGLFAAHAPTRGHLARLLIQQGHAANSRDAFERFLGVGAPAYAPKRLLPVEETIALIHQAGGAAVLAHPARYSGTPDLDALVEAGIDGLECCYPSHPQAEVDRLEAFARAHDLIVTGGSDFHSPDSRCDLGAQPVPADALERLRARAAAHRAAARSARALG